MKERKSNVRRSSAPVDDGRRSTSRRASRPESARSDRFDPSAYGRQTSSGAYSRTSDSRGEEPSGSYGRRISQAEYTRQRKKRKRRKIMGVALAIVLVVCLGGAGVAFAYYNGISANLHEGVDDNLRQELVQTDLTNEPFYMLLMGTDGSNDRAASAEYEGDQFRSDSMMLVRIDPIDNKVTLVSIHRDTLVDMGEYGQNKINAAHAIGGAALTVKTVSELAGVPISHYAEINFDGFRDIVNALGGVEVDVPMEIDDDDAGGYLAQGPQTLNGDQALILCRARHAYDNYGDGDSYRAANQRLVLAAIAKKILAADIGTMASTVTALSSYVTTDLEITDIVGLAQAMQGLDPANDIYSAMEPTTSAYVDGVWYEYTNTAAWKTMMDRVNKGLPPTEEDIVDEYSGTVLATTGNGEVSSSGSSNNTAPSSKKAGNVVIKNGNGVAGSANEAATKLQAVGYTVETGNANDFDYSQTIVIYNTANQANEAKEIATTIGVGKAQLNDGTYAFTGDFLVVIGADWV
ncbi:MAG: LCP family protein [Raoultibacter sp.]